MEQNTNTTAIYPTVLERDCFTYVTPQKRYEGARLRGKISVMQFPAISAARAHTASNVVTTLDTRVLYQVRELIYPGETSIPVEGKWIYAFHVNNATVLAEVFAENETHWWFRYNPTFPANASLPVPDKFCDGKLELPMLKSTEAPANVGFLISPFRLTSEAVNLLLEDKEKLKASCVMAERESQQSLFAAVPDAYRWSEDAHEKYYIPLLNQWQNYVFDEKNQAKNFIAGTLKSWTEAVEKGRIWDTTDPLGIKNELREGAIENWLDEYKKIEEELRIEAEKAASYLYQCVRAREHQALEKASIESGGIALSVTFQNWAIVAGRAVECAQGKVFAEQIFKDDSRFPKQFIFPEDSAPPLLERLGVNFPNTRYAWLAAVSIYGDLIPAILKRFEEIKAAQEADNIRKSVLVWLDKIYGPVNKIKNYKEFQKTIPASFKNYNGQILRHNLRYSKSVKGFETDPQKIAELQELYNDLAGNVTHADIAEVSGAAGKVPVATPKKVDMSPATREKVVEWLDKYFSRTYNEKRLDILRIWEEAPDSLSYASHEARLLRQNLKEYGSVKGLVTNKETLKELNQIYDDILNQTSAADLPVLPEMQLDKATLNKALKEKSGADDVNHVIEKALAKNGYKESFVIRFLKKNIFKIGITLETLNVLFSAKDYFGDKERPGYKLVSLIGASADFSSVLFGSLAETAKRGTLLRGISGFAGVIGGICQYSDEVRQAGEGYLQNQYGVTVGHTIAAAGAGMTAIAGGLILAKACGVGAAAGGPWGVAIGAIGAGLIITGNLIAAWLKDNMNEQFALYCYFGKRYQMEKSEAEKDRKYFDWVEHALPTSDILKEARTLMWLLCGFQIKRHGGQYAGNPTDGEEFKPVTVIEITPNYVTPEAKFEIVLEQKYRVANAETLQAVLTVDPDKDEVVFLRGNMQPLILAKGVERDKETRLVKSIRLYIKPLKVKYQNQAISFEEYRRKVSHKDWASLSRGCETSNVKVRLTLGNIIEPSSSQYATLDTLEDEAVNSLDTSKWKY